MTTAVVFAYHSVGVRCLSVLLAHDIEVKLVVTHEDAPGENIWFPSVAALAQEQRIPVITPPDPHEPRAFAKIKAAAPDFIFSFYYRSMLKPEVLAVARRGAYNMHGSLLPKFRGRVPINWAIIHGETQTGASLHEMVVKPDAGRLVDQMAVPIYPNDTAREVFDKVVVAAELVLDRSLEPLMAGVAKHTPMDLSKGSYFGGRKPEDGRIDWRSSAAHIHNLVRAVAPPFPGAFTEIDGERLFIHRTRLLGAAQLAARPAATLFAPEGAQQIGAICADGRSLALLETALARGPISLNEFVLRFGRGPIFPT